MDAFSRRGFGHRLGLLAVTLLLANIGPRSMAADGTLFADGLVSNGLSVQFTDNFLNRPDWRERLGQVSALGATVVRIDLNWPWVEKQPGQYDWALYDDYTNELSRRHLRPLFILNRPNPVHGGRYSESWIGRRKDGVLPPSTSDEIAAFARWAAAAAERYKALAPIWELWNEPDQDGFWPPRPRPRDYVALAREACVAIRKRVPGAFVTGPAAAQMPTVWRPEKPLFQAVLGDATLLDCLDAISLHTHRFGQAPETASRDYAVLRRKYLNALPSASAQKPLIDSEWGDSVYRSGISEETQARWLPRMFLVNAMEHVALTNWYCLMDVGADDGEMEDRFGLIREDGSQRPAYRAYQTMAHEIGAMSLRDVIRRFDPDTMKGPTILRFCDAANSACKLVYWTNEQSPATDDIGVSNWRSTGPAISYLGDAVAESSKSGGLTVRPQPYVQYLPVAAID